MIHMITLKSPFMELLSQKTLPFCLVPCARNALWYTKHLDTDVIDSGCL